MINLLWLAGGLVVLVWGAELLVKGASRLAAAFGIAPLIIGLTVVAFGTSAPELAVSVMAGMAGKAELAVGNVVGSNIANILLVLGMAAVVAPLAVARQLIRLDLPLMVAASATVVVMALDGAISRGEGALLFAGVVAYTLFLIVQARRDKAAAVAADDEFEREFGLHEAPGWHSHLRNGGLLLAGLVMLVAGSKALVTGAVAIAVSLGVSEMVIGLTIVAVGTSLPEVATSVVASMRGERDIAVGNVVGSNIFNLLSVLGLSSLVTSGGLPVPASAIAVDLPLMLGVALVCLPIFFSGWRITRSEGVLFLLAYVAYTSWLCLDALANPVAAPLGHGLLWYGVPLALLVIAVSLYRDRHLHR